jgi:hypothetical protein
LVLYMSMLGCRTDPPPLPAVSGKHQQIVIISTAIDRPHSWTDGLRWGPSRVRDVSDVQTHMADV